VKTISTFLKEESRLLYNRKKKGPIDNHIYIFARRDEAEDNSKQRQLKTTKSY